MTQQIEASPTFANEAQARAYRESHDSSEHLGWSKATKTALPNQLPAEIDALRTVFRFYFFAKRMASVPVSIAR